MTQPSTQGPTLATASMMARLTPGIRRLWYNASCSHPEFCRQGSSIENRHMASTDLQEIQKLAGSHPDLVVKAPQAKTIICPRLVPRKSKSQQVPTQIAFDESPQTLKPSYAINWSPVPVSRLLKQKPSHVAVGSSSRISAVRPMQGQRTRHSQTLNLGIPDSDTKDLSSDGRAFAEAADLMVVTKSPEARLV